MEAQGKEQDKGGLIMDDIIKEAETIAIESNYLTVLAQYIGTRINTYDVRTDYQKMVRFAWLSDLLLISIKNLEVRMKELDQEARGLC